MDLKVSTVEEAWKFLYNIVYDFSGGEFRIHTNKKGIRLYVNFTNLKFTGYSKHFIILKSDDNSKRFIHSEVYDFKDAIYYDSIIGENLIECVNSCLADLPGPIEIHVGESSAERSAKAAYYPGCIRWFEGTAKEFRNLSRQ